MLLLANSSVLQACMSHLKYNAGSILQRVGQPAGTEVVFPALTLMNGHIGSKEHQAHTDTFFPNIPPQNLLEKTWQKVFMGMTVIWMNYGSCLRLKDE